MSGPPPRRRLRADELPRSGVADPLLSLRARTPGPRGLAPKIGLAALGLLILFAMVALMGAAKYFSPRSNLEKPAATVQTR